MWAILGMYMILASTFTIGKAVLFYAQPIFFVATRMIIAGIVLLGYTFFFRRSSWRFNSQHLPLFACIVLFHIYGAFVFEFIAMKSMDSSKVCLLYGLSPFFTALCVYYFFGEHLSYNKKIGLLLGFVGFIPILVATPAHEGTTFLYISGADMCMLLSVIAAVLGWIAMKQLVMLGYWPLIVNGIGMFIGGWLALVTSLLYEAQWDSSDAFLGLVSNVPAFAWYTSISIIVANMFCYNAYGFLLKRYSTTFISFAGFTCPLFVALYGWLFLGEVITIWFFTSVAIVTVGLYLFYKEELREQSQL